MLLDILYTKLRKGFLKVFKCCALKIGEKNKKVRGRMRDLMQNLSILQTDFVVASKLIFWKNCLQQQNSKSHRRSASCALKKEDVEILVIFAMNARLHYAKCHATLNTILRKLCFRSTKVLML